jgi:hypothetical protein
VGLEVKVHLFLIVFPDGDESYRCSGPFPQSPPKLPETTDLGGKLRKNYRKRGRELSLFITVFHIFYITQILVI